MKESEFRRSNPWPDAEPARPRVTREDIVRNALEVLDHGGLDGLTMRRLAKRMGIKAASLYNHVRGKDDLLASIADAICGQIPDIDRARAWRGQLEALAVQFRKALLAHRDGARVLAATPPAGPNRLRLIEQVLRILVGAGFSTVEATDVASVHNSYVVGFVLDETLGRANDKASLRRTREAARRWFKSLSREQYPTLVALADELVDASTDRRFAFGVRALLDGFASRRSRK